MNLKQLRDKNTTRAGEWDASQLPVTFVSTELAGEVGEACNEVKKLERHRVGIPGGKDSTLDLAEELADVIICTDLLAARYDIDLGDAVARKFNKTSDKHGFKTRFEAGKTAPTPSDKDAEYVNDLELLLAIMTRWLEAGDQSRYILVRRDVNAAYQLLRRRGVTTAYSRFEPQPTQTKEDNHDTSE